jgi:hypothetical protein
VPVSELPGRISALSERLHSCIETASYVSRSAAECESCLSELRGLTSTHCEHHPAELALAVVNCTCPGVLGTADSGLGSRLAEIANPRGGGGVLEYEPRPRATTVLFQPSRRMRELASAISTDLVRAAQSVARR